MRERWDKFCDERRPDDHRPAYIGISLFWLLGATTRDEHMLVFLTLGLLILWLLYAMDFL